MGIRSPFGYVGYEVKFAETTVHLLKNFCSGCHTNEDFGNGCKGCPAGQLFFAAKEYVMDAYESDILKKETKALKEIKKQLKLIEPYPLIGGMIYSKLNILGDLNIAIAKLKTIESDRIDYILADKARRKELDKIDLKIKEEKKHGVQKQDNTKGDGKNGKN